MINETIPSASYTLFDEMKEGIILVDNRGVICYFNKSAERMLQKQYHLQIDQHILSSIPNSGMMRVLHTKRKEEQKMFAISENDYLLISRYPIENKGNQVIGAVAVLQEASRKRDWMDEDNIQILLNLILQKSAEAYAVVDELGQIIMQNSSYEELLSILEQQNEISLIAKNREEVFQTRRDSEITINTDAVCLHIKSSPIIVDGILKGCLQIINNQSETIHVEKELRLTKTIIRRLEQSYQFEDFIYQSPFMKFAVEQAKLAATNRRVLFIRGEEGSGKFMLANAIHNYGENKFQLFKRIHPKRNREQLIMFLGNDSNDRGTVYLENITCLSMDEQALLLELIRSYGKEDKQYPFRLIVSSPIKLEKALIAGVFLEELYDELMKSNIYLPPLSERKEDIFPLAKYFLLELNKESGRCISEISIDAKKELEAYPYTANVQELKAILQLAVIKAQEEEMVLKSEHLVLPVKIKEKQIDLNNETDNDNQTLSEQVEKYEKVIIEKTLRKLDGNKTLTAKTLGLSVRNLYYKLDKYNLN
ncbi:helix-turn-helix domain-containing protein [Niallia sp. FSL W8-0635]|uniref:helix-turn-helix domain-containing protein n=1 Tax=Niallia sp. FSL W8-0635 TaxID=2975337 RepID=UPI0009D33FBE|nr:Nif-specific regulatory protein [Mycobacteroides abscessus subsp. abscessus]HEO8418720.1 sigma 54-interacting transcriptional regulator [Yersinia enterocolitica]